MRIMKNKNKGFSLVELIVVIAVLAVIAAVLAPSLMQYTENSRAQKDVSAMDEVVNAVQLAVADEKCFDEALKYSCTNNYITYSDSSGNYGQQINDGEFWAPDGSGRATTITFNPEYGSNNQIIYDLSKGLVNDMTYGNGSTTSGRVMEGALIEDNQCYLSRLTNLYNVIRQTVGNDVLTTSQTYRNSSFTVFIKFTQKDGVTVADVNGSFNGTNLYEGAEASKGSNTSTYDTETGDAITSIKTPGKTESNYTSSDLMGSVTLSGNLTEYGSSSNIDTSKGVYYVGVTSDKKGNYSGATAVYKNGEFPDTVQTGDVYVIGDYEYRYNQYYFTASKWVINESQNGWGVRVLHTGQTQYQTLLSSINSKPLTNLHDLFAGCGYFESLPSNFVIPSTVTVTESMFYSCKGLKKLPDNFVIHANIQNMKCMFYGCEALQDDLIMINANPTNYSQCFYLTKGTIRIGGSSNKLAEIAATDGYSDMSAKDNVRALNIIPEGGVYYVGVNSNKIGDYTGATAIYTEGYTFPQNINKGDVYVYGDYEYRYGQQTTNGKAWISTSNYWGVSAIDKTKTHYGDILSSINGKIVGTMAGAFYNCGQLIEAPKIPNTIENMYSAFYGCSNLTTITSEIPRSVKLIGYAFSGCNKLTGIITINAEPSSYVYCFSSTTQPITITGTSTKLNELAATANNGNVTVQQ